MDRLPADQPRPDQRRPDRPGLPGNPIPLSAGARHHLEEKNAVRTERDARGEGDGERGAGRAGGPRLASRSPPSWRRPRRRPGTLYRATLVQAAPGRLLDLIDLDKALAASVGQRRRGASLDAPQPGRQVGPAHPLADGELDRLLRRGTGCAPAALESGVRGRAGEGPRLDRLAGGCLRLRAAAAGVRDRFTKAGYFHVEMFVASPGRQAELLREREMENAYDRALGLPDNLIFTRIAARPGTSSRSAATATSSTMPRAPTSPTRPRRRPRRAAGFEARTFHRPVPADLDPRASRHLADRTVR